jgi:formylmethanofuran dehydrogenase subunit E
MTPEKKIDAKLQRQRREALDRCVAYHGHMCLGQVLGIHLAFRGMEEIGQTDPKHMLVYVENDRCIADAIQILTGTRLGRRTMKLVNYGKMAATFINQETDTAVRVNVSKRLNEIIGKLSEDREEKRRQQEEVLMAPSDQVVSVRRVTVDVHPNDLPGKPKRSVPCVRCGEKVMDFKDVEGPDGPLCRSCSEGAYYSLAGEDDHGA